MGGNVSKYNVPSILKKEREGGREGEKEGGSFLTPNPVPT